jgi:hypothetical protein
VGVRRVAFAYERAESPTDADAARPHQSDPTLTHRNFVPPGEMRKLIRDGAPREERERLSRFGGYEPLK